MRVNEFKDLQEFINEYDFESNIDCEKHIGIEFTYNNNYYRMCCEPLDISEFPLLENGKLGRYDVNIVHWITDTEFEYELIGWYSDMNDLLENCIIENKKFKDIIMDDNTEIIGKD